MVLTWVISRMSTYISRIISLRDSDKRPIKYRKSGKQYATACPIMNDDSDSSDADDEYSSDDEYLIIPSDTEGEHKNDSDNILDTDASSDLEIIEDYFDTLLPLHHQDSHDTDCKSGEPEEADVPVLKLNLPGHSGAGVTGEACNTIDDKLIAENSSSLVLEKSTTLRDGSTALQQTDEAYEGDDSWSITSECFDDSWAFELEAAEEDRIARQEEELSVAKTRRNPLQGTYIPPRSILRSARSNRNQDRKVAFAVRPGVFDE